MRSARSRGRHAISRRRDGFSLLEVILSIAVLFASGIALAQLASLGRRHADRAESMTTAQMLCQNKMNELIAGLTPLTSATDTPFLEFPEWTFSIDVQPASWNGLLAVKVNVAELPTTDDRPTPSVPFRGASAATTVNVRPRFSLVRWVRSTSTFAAEDSEPFGSPGDTAFAGAKR